MYAAEELLLRSKVPMHATHESGYLLPLQQPRRLVFAISCHEDDEHRNEALSDYM